MDPLTQGLLGGIVTQAISSKGHHRKAFVIGALSGMAPDLDIFIRSEADPLMAIEYHRHFTHALAFVPFGALLMALAFYPFVRHSMQFRYIYMFAFLGYATHGVLDACTTYGTMLYWPFLQERVGWDIVSVIDPLVTIPLFLGAAIGFFWRSHAAAKIGFVLALAYLTLGWWQHQNVSKAVHDFAKQHGHEVERIKLNTTLGNILWWRTVYQYNGRYYISSVLAKPWETTIVKNGTNIRALTDAEVLTLVPYQSTQYQDYLRFKNFAQGFVTWYPGRENEYIVGDIRYGNHPESAKAMWGITLNPKQAQAHVARTGLITAADRAHFFDTLFETLGILDKN